MEPESRTFVHKIQLSIYIHSLCKNLYCVTLFHRILITLECRYNLYVCALVSLLGLTLAGPFQEEPEFPYEYPDVEFPDENEEGTQQYYTPPENDARLMNSDDEQEKDEDAKIEVYYQNNWDGDLSVECSPGHGIFHFQSIHDNKREDRRWYFGCKQVITHLTV